MNRENWIPTLLAGSLLLAPWLAAASSLLQGVTEIGNPSEHNCAVVAGGVRCWGSNAFGVLGIGSNYNGTYLAEAVPALATGVTAVSVGSGHTCAIAAGGAAKCWGWNALGQLGTGTFVDAYAPANVLGLGAGIRQISAGHRHTCAITTTGSAKCWGENHNGKVGNGAVSYGVGAPADVVGLDSGVIAIAAGGEHSCALTTGGGVKCWGSNASGQLGDGTDTDSPIPVDVLGLASGVAAIHASHLAFTTCALKSGGDVVCWGRPSGIDGVKNASAIAVGYGCALVAGGVKCAGNNQEGQLGDGTYFDSATPVDVVGLGSGVIAISAGYFATCALTTAGGAKCWGTNRNGQLGDGSATGSPVPVDVRGIDACAGFVDVDNADALCANVAWLRNRQITLGCLPEAYCPFGAVTRLAMATYLNRTGTIFATTPTIAQALTGGFDPTAARVVCETADVPVATHPRRAYVDAVFSATAAADVSLAAELAASSDHGATWQALSTGAHRGSIIATRWANLRTLGHHDLDADASVRFGIVVSRGGLPGAATIADSACNLRARLDNRNATTPPLD